MRETRGQGAEVEGQRAGVCRQRSCRSFPASFLLLLVLSNGCAQRRQDVSLSRFYPIGICGAGKADNLPVLRNAGFNLVLGPTDRGYLDAALTNQVAVLVSLHDKDEQAREDVERFDHHPAVWAWFLEDEPEMKGIPPAKIFARNQLVKSCGGQKPTVVVLFKGYEALDYGNIADITICDRYPVPWLPLCNFGQHLRMVRLALDKEKPLIAIVQAFDWRYYAEMLSDVDPASLRPPTYDEVRCMTYCALAQRVNGLMYYSYDDGPGRWRMQEHPETWEALCRVVKEVNTRLPLFQAEHVWWPKDQRWQDRDRRFNAALESSIDSVLLRVNEGNASVPQGYYIMAVNNTDQQHVYSFTPPFQVAGKVAVFDENRDLVAQNGWLLDTFAPYAVHVYGPLKRAE